MEDEKVINAQLDIMTALTKLAICNTYYDCKKEIKSLNDSIDKYNELSSNKLVCLNNYKIDRQTSSLESHYLCKIVSFDVTTNSFTINDNYKYDNLRFK